MKWPQEVAEIRYPSAADRTEQPAMWYAPKTSAPVPLLVALHPWSAGYRRGQSVPYAEWCIRKDWVFIHPDFRGPNLRPEACGSELVVQDILSAVDYARAAANVDPRRIYLMGGSGGGYATLLMAGRAPRLWTAASAWVPILDLAVWHRDATARLNKYVKEMEACCGGAPGASPEVDRQYERRSAKTWLANAASVPLDINAGITDGHTGSVPISHSLLAFNMLARPEDRLTQEEIDWFVAKQSAPEHLRREIVDPAYGEKRPLFRRASNNVRVTIFQGGHDELHEAGLTWLDGQRR
jgi:acetyl esterase/lipase